MEEWLLYFLSPSGFIGTLSYIFLEAPLFIVWGVGLAVCLKRWRQHPQLSGLMGLALAGFILATLMHVVLGDLNFPGHPVSWPSQVLPSGTGKEDFDAFLRLRNQAFIFVQAGLWGLILGAIWRSHQE